MIELHWSLTAPWWIVPLYIGGIVVIIIAIYIGAALLDRWLGR